MRLGAVFPRGFSPRALATRASSATIERCRRAAISSSEWPLAISSRTSCSRAVGESSSGSIGPVGAVAAITVAGEPGLAEVAAGAFESWQQALAGRLRAAGLPRAEATERAAVLIAVMEGAQILCRAAGSTAPFDRAAKSLLRDAPDGR